MYRISNLSFNQIPFKIFGQGYNCMKIKSMTSNLINVNEKSIKFFQFDQMNHEK